MMIDPTTEPICERCCTEASGNGSTRWVAGFLCQHWTALEIVLVLTVAIALIQLALPFFTKILIDDVLLARNKQLLPVLCLSFLGMLLVIFLTNLLSRYLYVRTSARVLLQMRCWFLAALQQRELHFYTRTRAGDILSRLNNDLAEVQRISFDIPLQLTSNLLLLIGAAFILARLNSTLFIISCISTVLAFVAVQRFRPRIYDSFHSLRQESALIGSSLLESVLGMRLICSFNQEEARLQEFERLNFGYNRRIVKFQMFAFAATGSPLELLQGRPRPEHGTTQIDQSAAVGA